jgi:hypothetical protein
VAKSTSGKNMIRSPEDSGLFLLRTTGVIALLVIVTNAVVVFALNPVQALFLPSLSQATSLVFLPYGLKILATVVLRFKAVPGLVVGSAIATVLIWRIPDPFTIILLSLIAGLVPWLIFELLKAMRIEVFFECYHENLPPLQNILGAALICSAVNAVLMDVTLTLLGQENDRLAIAAFVIGDCMGLVVAWVLAKSGLDMLRKIY